MHRRGDHEAEFLGLAAAGLVIDAAIGNEARPGIAGIAQLAGRLGKSKRKLGLDENSGLEGTLRGSVHAIESELGKINDAPAKVAMLMMRRHEKDFMLRQDAKYGVQMKQAAKDLEFERAAALRDEINRLKKMIK